MKNNNDDALESYFSSMLTEAKPAPVIVETPIATEPLNVAVLPETLRFAEAEESTVELAETVTPVATVANVASVEPTQEVESGWKNIEVEKEFQALFFELSGLTFAVPLKDLGGINYIDDSMNTLFGKPDWFSGVITHNKSMFNIVDTAKWISTGESAETLNYSHFIVLGSTQWGLSCEKLLGTETLVHSQIKWRKSEGKRPWLAGMVKEKMCALIHATELVKLLNNGMNIHGN